MLRGPSHGDLHGRNVLVGVREGDDGVVWPALFDYEHMAADNLIGWDFVKLETELKVRAYPHVFGDQGPLRRYVVAVQAFEQELAERTEQHRPNADWPAAGGATPRERLLTLLLTLRRLAGHHLGKAAGRPEEWLEEYYFLLGCYGVYSVRFENQSVQERAGAFVSGGVAAARFAWQRREKQTFTSDEVEAVLARRYPGYREPLQIAWGWNRSGDPVKLAQAHTLLTALAEHYAYVLHVWYELAFNLVKQKKRDDALAVLDQIGERFRGMLDEDVLSLWGRCCKDRGDDFRDAGLKFPAGRAERVADFTEADRAYQEACTRYEQAYLLNRNWFPGINLATLRLLRAALAADLNRTTDKDDYLAAARRLAAELLQAAPAWTERLKDDNIWIPATRAEAQLLLGHWDDAAAQYQIALDQPNLQPDNRKTMKDQVRRIADAYGLLRIPMEGPLADPERFFAAE